MCPAEPVPSPAGTTAARPRAAPCAETPPESGAEVERDAVNLRAFEGAEGCLPGPAPIRAGRQPWSVPDQSAQSLTVAGPRLRKYRAARAARDSSLDRGVVAAGPTRSPNAAYVCRSASGSTADRCSADDHPINLRMHDEVRQCQAARRRIPHAATRPPAAHVSGAGRLPPLRRARRRSGRCRGVDPRPAVGGGVCLVHPRRRQRTEPGEIGPMHEMPRRPQEVRPQDPAVRHCLPDVVRRCTGGPLPQGPACIRILLRLDGEQVLQGILRGGCPGERSCWLASRVPTTASASMLTSCLSPRRSATAGRRRRQSAGRG